MGIINKPITGGGTTLWGFRHIYPILKGAVPMSNEMFHEYRYLEL